jgi:hypothetical protein
MKLMSVFQQSNWSSQICLHNIFKKTLYVSFQYPTNSTTMTTEVEARMKFYVETGHKGTKKIRKPF